MSSASIIVSIEILGKENISIPKSILYNFSNSVSFSIKMFLSYLYTLPYLLFLLISQSANFSFRLPKSTSFASFEIVYVKSENNFEQIDLYCSKLISEKTPILSVAESIDFSISNFL